MKQEKSENKSKGEIGERLACEYLMERGYNVVEKNWKHMRFELDLIVSKNNKIIFVEVKLRYSRVYGEPWEAVNKSKRKKICISADAYIRKMDITLEPRFDIVSIVQGNGKTEILHIEDAFYPTV